MQKLNRYSKHVVFLVIVLFNGITQVSGQELEDSVKVMRKKVSPTFELAMAAPINLSGRKVVLDGHIGIGAEVNWTDKWFSEIQVQGIAKSAGRGIGMMGIKLGMGHRLNDNYNLTGGSGFYFGSSDFDRTIPGFFCDLGLANKYMGFRFKYDKLIGTKPWDHETVSLGWDVKGKPALIVAGTAVVVGGIIGYIILSAIGNSR